MRLGQRVLERARELVGIHPFLSTVRKKPASPASRYWHYFCFHFFFSSDNNSAVLFFKHFLYMLQQKQHIDSSCYFLGSWQGKVFPTGNRTKVWSPGDQPQFCLSLAKWWPAELPFPSQMLTADDVYDAIRKYPYQIFRNTRQLLQTTVQWNFISFCMLNRKKGFTFKR